MKTYEGIFTKKSCRASIKYLYYKLTGAIMQLNLYFCKVCLEAWPKEADVKFKFSAMKENSDFVIRFGRRELYVIPRYSKTFTE